MGSRRARRAHGRVQSALGSHTRRINHPVGVKKAARLNSRAQKKAKILASAKAARIQASQESPLLIAIISVCNVTDSNLSKLSSTLLSTECMKNTRRLETFVIRREGFSEREIFIGALDAAKVADVVLLVFDGERERMDVLGAELVISMREQGLPSVFGVALGKGGADPALRKMRGRVLAAESIGADHALRPIPMLIDGEQNAEEVNKMALRRIVAKKTREVSWRARYGYMRIEAARSENVGGRDILSLCGWIRGRGMSANELVHITGFGTYKALEIIDASNGVKLSIRGEDGEPVESEVPVDELMGEQTWPPEIGEDSDQEEEEDQEARNDHQMEAENNNVMMTPMDDADPKDAEDYIEEEEEDLIEEGDNMSVDEEEVRKVRDAAKADALFPDEVDTPIDQPARVRFARYRGLKSLRTGEWDPKEQLPPQYAKLFQFKNMAATRKKVLKDATKEAEDAKNGAALNFAKAGHKAYIQLIDVPADIQNDICRKLNRTCGPTVACGMLRHENRQSVVHFGIRRVDEESSVDLKAKTHLEMHCGFVRFEGRPMFSEHNANSDKHKMERFLKHERYTVASFYGPSIYAPAPALLCHPGGSLIATGTALGADPDRIMLKRIILTGYPIKTQKNKGVVRYMFFKPDDIRWFKPVELWTKMGRSGHIVAPIGTHGHMKCIFDGSILHHDTICMTLYKRVYPKLVDQKEPHRQTM